MSESIQDIPIWNQIYLFIQTRTLFTPWFREVLRVQIGSETGPETKTPRPPGFPQPLLGSRSLCWCHLRATVPMFYFNQLLLLLWCPVSSEKGRGNPEWGEMFCSVDIPTHSASLEVPLWMPTHGLSVLILEELVLSPYNVVKDNNWLQPVGMRSPYLWPLGPRSFNPSPHLSADDGIQSEEAMGRESMTIILQYPFLSFWHNPDSVQGSKVPTYNFLLFPQTPLQLRIAMLHGSGQWDVGRHLCGVPEKSTLLHSKETQDQLVSSFYSVSLPPAWKVGKMSAGGLALFSPWAWEPHAMDGEQEARRVANSSWLPSASPETSQASEHVQMKKVLRKQEDFSLSSCSRTSLMLTYCLFVTQEWENLI